MSWVKANRILNSHDKAIAVSKEISGSLSSAQQNGRVVMVSMYDEAPDGDISLEEFERFAVDRLHVLRGIEDLKARNYKGDELLDRIVKLAQVHLKDATKESTMRKDVASHYVLRLAFCQTEDKRKWFLNQECELFRARFKDMLSSDQRAFIEQHGLPVQVLTRAEFEDVQECLKATLQSITNSVAQVQSLFSSSGAHESFYKVGFEKVPDLVAMRRVYLREGFAYVSRDQIGSLVMAPFRSHLSKHLALLSRQWSAFSAGEEKERLVPLVSGLSERYLGPDYNGVKSSGGSEESINASMLPRLQKESFPLCMSVMMDSLRTQHHLKHTGRQQLGLFLKGIGLPMEEAIRFWRTEMAPIAPGDKFDKQYLYNIRHNYGKEGKRQDYTPHSCLKIINAMPGPGQVHGCPYRVMGEESLRHSLSRLDLSASKVDEAVKKATQGHYQLACATVWEGKMGCSCDTGINHPNQYFAESRKVLTVDEKQSLPPTEEAMMTPAPTLRKTPRWEDGDGETTNSSHIDAHGKKKVAKIVA
ncbi:hypothetical protein M9435_006903 [Picochlorum sp. BPE23]|nr:hypothetical protein M9435_006903 [Picochlorum sp. BPE23]